MKSASYRDGLQPIHYGSHSQPIWRPLFCCSSQLIKGLKYSIIARVEMSSPVASFNTCANLRWRLFSGCYKAPALPPFENFLRFREKESRRRPTELAK